MDAMLGDRANVARIDPLDYPHFVRALGMCADRADRFGRRAGGGARARQARAGHARDDRAARRRRRRHRKAGRHRRETASFPKSSRLLDDKHAYSAMARAHNPFGDGHAAARIARIVARWFRTAELKVAVVGLGYIGLPTAAVIARTGAQVLGIDVTPSRRRHGQFGQGPYRGGRSRRARLGRGRARQRCAPRLQIEPADVFVIAVPTPFGDDHAPDIGYVLHAATHDRRRAEGRRRRHPRIDLAGRHHREGARPARRAAPRPQGARPDCADAADIAIAYCPERVLPGRILVELIDNDRVHRRHHAALRAQGADLLPPLRARRLRHHHRARGGNDQADRKRVPRRQHRLRQRTVAASPTRWASMCGR